MRQQRDEKRHQHDDAQHERDASFTPDAVCIKRRDTIGALVDKFVATGTHRIFIVDDATPTDVSSDLDAWFDLVEGAGHDEDHFAYWRDPHEFLNPLLVERPNGDFAHLIVRQLLHDAYALALWRALTGWLGGYFMWVVAIAILEPMNIRVDHRGHCL